MTYTDRFVQVEDYLAHLDPMMASISDPFVQGRYIGFIATSAVTAYELAIKDIFYAFADKKNSVLGNLTRARFSRLNGKIKLDDLKREHVKSFGEKYLVRFKRNLEIADDAYVRVHRNSPKTAYNNVITWRHTFVHEGEPPNTTNYPEIKKNYLAGKEVIHCLFRTMVR
ncbi:HEPN domain-containing protein [Komagataeibacter rhaeticus]|uniref:HEPN domain-containing protein n=1 Tax=Komagataeibacter rhaeticus TaxID=215221 RepID=UPI0011BE6406|nr:HEPN domain-containing protein [Komagataeibacter rhaeticus]